MVVGVVLLFIHIRMGGDIIRIHRNGDCRTIGNEDMSPQEKALELIDKFTFEIGKFNAKQCALVSVDEMIEVALWAGDIDGEIEDGSKEYYLIVKEELRKL